MEVMVILQKLSCNIKRKYKNKWNLMEKNGLELIWKKDSIKLEPL
jgi:hypothetical protein